MNVKNPYLKHKYIPDEEQQLIKDGVIPENKAFFVEWVPITSKVDIELKDHNNKIFQDDTTQARMVQMLVGKKKEIITSNCIVGWGNLFCEGEEISFGLDKIDYILPVLDEVVSYIEKESYLTDSQIKN